MPLIDVLKLHNFFFSTCPYPVDTFHFDASIREYHILFFRTCIRISGCDCWVLKSFVLNSIIVFPHSLESCAQCSFWMFYSYYHKSLFYVCGCDLLILDSLKFNIVSYSKTCSNPVDSVHFVPSLRKYHGRLFNALD